MSNLRERDGKLRENWYIVCLESELKAKPIQRLIYDKKVVIFRGNKGIAVLDDTCLHRKATLSKGRVEKGQLICPYHSWTYNTDGEVAHVPSEGENQNIGARCLKSYAVHLKDGAVWIWMGDEKASDTSKIWNFPHYAERGWSHYFMVTDFDNEVTNLVENFVDVPHTVSVHKGWFRNKSLQKVPFNTATSNGEVLVTYDSPDDNIGVLMRPLLNPKNESMLHTDKFIYPNITRVDYSFGQNYKYVINSECTPVSTMRSRVYTYIAYKIPVIGSFFKPLIQYYTRQVINQDVWIMKVQSENLDTVNGNTFQSTPADEPHIHIERLRKQGVTTPAKVYEVEMNSDHTMWI